MSDAIKPDEQIITPQVNSKAEFTETVNDFGDSFEIFREAISNAFDYQATEMKIAIETAEIGGYTRVVITLTDNGTGMSRDVLANDFWGLGFSQSRGKANLIGNKGHGTKIYLRSQKVEVRTQSTQGAFYSVCLEPYAALTRDELHQPTVKSIEPFLKGSGTEIRVEGYSDNERSKYYYETVKDYLLWHTKIGSVEKEFGITTHENFKLLLKCLDSEDYQDMRFGHVFAKENYDLAALYKKYEFDAHLHYAKRYLWQDKRLTKFPEVKFDVVIYVEGDKAKREYNKMIRARSYKDTGTYKVSDQYGLWLCRDFIPIESKNEWITGFGNGSNSFVLLHGFVNCQKFKLTANRGAVSNSNPEILAELRLEVAGMIAQIDSDLRKGDIFTLVGWQAEAKTLKQEKEDFDKRVKHIADRAFYVIDKRKLLVPRYESELYAFLIALYTLRPDAFEFEPLDYNTTQGIDVVARNKNADGINVPSYGYIELKHLLTGQMNHTFKHISRIVCWDFPKDFSPNTEYVDLTHESPRKLRLEKDETGLPIYTLDAPKKNKIEVIRLKEMIEKRLLILPISPTAAAVTL